MLRVVLEDVRNFILNNLFSSSTHSFGFWNDLKEDDVDNSTGRNTCNNNKEGGIGRLGKPAPANSDNFPSTKFSREFD